MGEAWLKQDRSKQYHKDYTRLMEVMVQKGYTKMSFQKVQQGKT